MSPPPSTSTATAPINDDDFSNLPNVPSDLPDVPSTSFEKKDDDDIDFDELSKRFEELKKKK